MQAKSNAGPDIAVPQQALPTVAKKRSGTEVDQRLGRLLKPSKARDSWPSSLFKQAASSGHEPAPPELPDDDDTHLKRNSSNLRRLPEQLRSKFAKNQDKASSLVNQHTASASYYKSLMDL
ncbi:hypothetical protein MTO96_015259, partial [Rhipicephalus appendiculatus]